MSFREADPVVASFIDSLRECFGAEGINQRQREGRGGIPGRFYYKGPAGEFGTPAPPARHEFTADQLVLEAVPVVGVKRK
jgi:hypothetical protein